ncbi:hypothetical protein ACFL6C_04645 [Myxococcota bacterium]
MSSKVLVEQKLPEGVTLTSALDLASKVAMTLDRAGVTVVEKSDRPLRATEATVHIGPNGAEVILGAYNPMLFDQVREAIPAQMPSVVRVQSNSRGADLSAKQCVPLGPLRSSKPPTNLIVRKCGEISDSEIAPMRAMVSEIFHRYRGYLSIPPSVLLEVHPVAEPEFIVGETKLVLGLHRTAAADEPTLSSILHETGHLLFAHNIELVDGRSLAGIRSSDNELLSQRFKERNAAEEKQRQTSAPLLREYYRLSKAERHEEAKPLFERYERLLDKLEPPVAAATQRVEAALQERDRKLKGPIRGYAELWADLTALVMTDDPRVMSKGLQVFVTNEQGLEDHTRLRISQRDWSRPARHRFRFDNGRGEDDDYTLLDISRNYFWRHYLSDPGVDKVEFSIALLQVMEEESRAFLAGELKASHRDLNERLQTKLNHRMGRPHLPIDVTLESDDIWSTINPHDFPELLEHARGDRPKNPTDA